MVNAPYPGLFDVHVVDININNDRPALKEQVFL